MCQWDAHYTRIALVTVPLRLGPKTRRDSTLISSCDCQIYLSDQPNKIQGCSEAVQWLLRRSSVETFIEWARSVTVFGHGAIACTTFIVHERSGVLLVSPTTSRPSYNETPSPRPWLLVTCQIQRSSFPGICHCQPKLISAARKDSRQAVQHSPRTVGEGKRASSLHRA